MTKKTILICAVAFLFVLCATRAIGVMFRQPPEDDPTPKIAGQKVPDAFLKIDFEKRYDFYCKIHEPNSKVFRGCKVVGFTGSWSEERGGSFRTSVYPFFEGDLVLELPDGRLAYIPPSLIDYFEEAAPKQ